MIKSVHIENVQSHKNTHLDLAPGVNIIVGTSDAGKSGALRAINWVRTNRPAGEALRSWWGGDTVVTIVTADDGAVERERSKKNKYTIFPEDAQAEPIKLEAMGQDVPAEVSTILRLDDVNVQYQMDPPFLLSRDWTPGRVAEYLNEAVGLDVIDRAQSNINAAIKRLQQRKTDAQVELDSSRKKLEDLQYVDDLAAAVKKLEADQARLTVVRRQEQELFNLIEDIKRLRTERQAIPDYIVVGQRIRKLSDMAAKVSPLRIKATALQTIVDDIARLNQQRRDAAAILPAERLIRYTVKQAERRQTLVTEAGQLETILAGLQNARETHEHLSWKLSVLEKDWHRLAPNVCPMCKGKGRLK